MTLKASGFRIICDRSECGRIEELPAHTEDFARSLALKLGWRLGPKADYCPSCERLLEAAGKLPPRPAQ